MAPELRLHLLGSLHIESNGHPVTGFDSPRLRALLAYLVLHQDVPQPRHFVAFLFWPDSTEEQALTNLRTLLSRLRQTLPAVDHYLSIDYNNLHWQSDTTFWCDVDAVKQAFSVAQQAKREGDSKRRQSALQEVADFYKGDLLPECYEDWLIRERDILREILITTLSQLATFMETTQETHAAIGYAQRLLRVDALNEEAYRQLMRLYAQAGNRAAALRVYQTCATTLELELGVSPDAQTHSEYEHLLAVKPETVDRTPVLRELSTEAPLVGREREWGMLQNTYQAAQSGKPQFVMISGVAGIGKTRLAEEFIRTAKRTSILALVAHCYAAQGDLPYAPVTDWLRTLPILEVAPVWQEALARLLPELAPGQADALPFSGFTESWHRHHLFEAAARAILGNRRSLILLLDDIQWCDHDTLEWLHFLLNFDSQAALMVIATCRVENTMDNAALAVLLDALAHSDQRVDIALAPLTERDTYILAEKLADNALDQNLSSAVYTGSEGNPLFIVEMMRMHLSKRLLPVDWRYEYRNNKVHILPQKVRTVLESRLAILSATARNVASIAAVIGREFTYTLLALISDCDEDALVQSLDELWNRRIIREQGEVAYIFSHDRIREVAYENLSAARRRMLHLRVAQGLATECDTGKSTAYAQVALHFEQAGNSHAAIPYYKQAGDVAQRTYAYEEAVKIYEKALGLLRKYAVSRDSNQLEVELLLALGASLMLLRGHSAPEVGTVYSRAWELCGTPGHSPFRYSALLGLRRYHFVRGEMQKACDLGVQLIAEAEKLDAPALLARAYMMHSETLYHVGEFKQSEYHSSTGYKLYIPLDQSPYLFDYGTDVGACCLAFGAIVLQFLGYFEQAQRKMQTAIELAKRINHPFTLSMVHIFAGMLYRIRRDISATQRAVETAIEIAQTRGFPTPVAWASGLQAWVQCQRGNLIEGINQLQQAMDACQAIGFNVESISQRVTLCDAYIQTCDFFRAGHVLEQAFDLVQTTGERCWEARLHCLRGEIQILQREFQAAEQSFERAIEIAREQQNRLYELRASISLAKLWRSQDRQAEAKTLLQGIYDWFSEGFETTDLEEARSLLRAL